MLAAAAYLHFHCKRGLLVFHKYPVRHLGFSAEGELKTRRNKNGREARVRCLQESSRLCPEAQILSLTWAYFRIASHKYSPHAFFPFVPKAGFELVFYSVPLFSAGRREDSSAALPKGRTQWRAVSRRSGGSAVWTLE